MFKKIYFKFELLKAFLAKNWRIIIIGVIVGSVVFINRQSVFRLVNSSLIQNEYIGIAGSGFYTESNLPASITNLISYGLTQVSDNQRIDNSPATKDWRYQVVSAKEYDYLFSLNNITWHDGQKLTAADVSYKIPGAKTVVVNSSTLKFVLTQPFSALPALLTQPLLKKGLVGLGPYKVTQTTYQEGFIKKLQLQPLDTTLPRQTYIFYNDEKELVSAYKMGKIDAIKDLINPYDLLSWPSTEINTSLSNSSYIALFINTEKFSDKKLRQALAYATPKTKDKKDRCVGPISPTSWAYNSAVKEYNQSPDRAVELMGENKPTVINLTINDRRLLSMAEEIKTAWETILGIKTNVTVETQLNTANFDVILGYGNIPTDPDQYAFWHSTQTNTNLTKLNNSRIDKLLEQGRQEQDIQERKKIYLDFQRFLLEESPAIFLSYPTNYDVARVK